MELVGVSAAGVPTNFTTLPIGFGACSDPQFGTTGAQFQTLSTQATVNIGVLRIFQSTSQSGGTTVTNNSAIANFQKFSGLSYGSASGSVSLGGCTVSQSTVGSGSPFTTTGLDAGGVTLTGPSGTPVALTAIPQVPGQSFAQLSAAYIPVTGGTFVFNGAGGVNVGSFAASVVFPNPLLTWTNQAAASVVNRAGGLTVTWSGGGSGTFVDISGSSASAIASGTFICIAPVSAGQFTVPSYVLEALPAGSGTVSVLNQSNYQTFAASGLDYGVASGSVGYNVNSTYN